MLGRQYKGVLRWQRRRRNVAPFFILYLSKRLHWLGEKSPKKKFKSSFNLKWGIISPTCNFNMNRKQKKIQIFLAISFFFFFLFFPVFSLYNNCVETDFPSAKTTFENLDQDYLLANEQNKSFAFGIGPSFIILGTYLFQTLPYPSFVISSLDQKLFALRCWEYPLPITHLFRLSLVNRYSVFRKMMDRNSMRKKEVMMIQTSFFL